MKKILIRTSLVFLLYTGMAANASALPFTGGRYHLPVIMQLTLIGSDD